MVLGSRSTGVALAALALLGAAASPRAAAAALLAPRPPAASLGTAPPSPAAPFATAPRLPAASFATAPPPQSRIFNGVRVGISQVPWHVLVYSETGSTIATCGGSILDATHVVTAAHCVSDEVDAGHVPGDPNGGGGLGVIAGVSDYRSAAALASFFRTGRMLPPGDSEQDATAASVRVHPGWPADQNQVDRFPSGDVAVITLAAGLDLSGPDAKAIALPPVAASVDGEPIPFNQSVTTAGFGKQNNASHPDGFLYFEPQSIVDSSACGALQVDAAVNLCAAALDGTTCSGDSGSGLVTTDSPPVLVGLVSAGPYPCQSGDPTEFTSLVAPENRLFLEGQNAPPRAPRQRSAVVLGAPSTLRPGDQISCSGGAFTDGAQVKWKITDETGRLVSAGAGPSFSYPLVTSDVGHTLTCRAYAWNAGGVAVSDPASTTTVVNPGPPTAPSPDAASPPGPAAATTPPTGARPTTPVVPPVKLRVTETVTAAKSIHRGNFLRIKVVASPLPAGADTVIVSAQQVGIASHSRTLAYSQSKSPKPTDTTATFLFGLRVPRHARTGARTITVKFFAYKLGLLQSSLSQSITVKITR